MFNDEDYSDSAYQSLNALCDAVILDMADQLVSAGKRKLVKKLKNLTLKDKVIILAGICLGGYLYTKSQNKADPYDLQSWPNAV